MLWYVLCYIMVFCVFCVMLQWKNNIIICYIIQAVPKRRKNGGWEVGAEWSGALNRGNKVLMIYEIKEWNGHKVSFLQILQCLFPYNNHIARWLSFKPWEENLILHPTSPDFLVGELCFGAFFHAVGFNREQ